MGFFRVLLFIGAVAAGLIAGPVACSEKPETAKVSGTARVRIPWLTEHGYALQDVELRGLDHLDEVSGTYARFYYGPKLTESGLDGPLAKARFVRGTDGVFRPSDVFSQDLAVMYAHIQGLADLDLEIGADRVLSYPRYVAVATRLRDEGKLFTNNSFYDGDRDAILMVPYTSGRLPLAQNAGVLAHEYFHGLFHRLVMSALIEKGCVPKRFRISAHGEDSLIAQFGGARPDRDDGVPLKSRQQGSPDDKDLPLSDRQGLYNSLLQKSLNEGLADVWAWVYSGDPDFLGLSLPQEKDARTLRSSAVRTKDFKVGTRTELFTEVKARAGVRGNGARSVDEAGLNRAAYRFGTGVSRMIKHLAELGGQAKEARVRLARRLVKALPLWREKAELSGEGWLEFRHFFEMAAKAEPLPSEECKEWVEAIGPGVSCEESGGMSVLKGDAPIATGAQP